MSKQLYGCLFVPDFAVAAVLRRDRNLRTPPALVFTGKAPNRFVYGANQPARDGGIQEGMPLAEATARFAAAQMAAASAAPRRSPRQDDGRGKGIRPYRLRPVAPHGVAIDGNGSDSRQREEAEAPPAARETGLGLQILPRDPEAEKQTQQELLDLALTVSPRVEDAALGLLIFDLAGMPDPHGSAGSLSYGAEKLGLAAQVAVSENRFVAVSAARTQPGVTHVFPGQEAGFLSVLPVDVLPLDTKEKETFERWGIRTIGELARLPEDSLVARFGVRGSQLSKLAHGQEDTLLQPYEPAPALEESLDLDWQVGELEPLAFLLSGLLDRLCVKLQGQQWAAAEIRVGLKLANGSRYERAVTLSYPLADPRVLLTLVRLDLAAHPPGEAIEGVAVAAQPTPRRLTQFSLLEPGLPSPEKLAVTLARLTNLVGPERVGAPVAPDTHRPGAFAVTAFAPASGSQRKRRRSNKGSANGALRLREVLEAQQAAPVKVGTLDPGPDESSGPPTRRSNVQPIDRPTNPRTQGSTEQRTDTASLSRRSLAFRCFRPPPEAEVILRNGQPVYMDSFEVRGSVHTRAGPWRVCGEWWTPHGWDYEEWDVEVNGRLYRICCQRSSQTWHVTGTYD